MKIGRLQRNGIIMNAGNVRGRNDCQTKFADHPGPMMYSGASIHGTISSARPCRLLGTRLCRKYSGPLDTIATVATTAMNFVENLYTCFSAYSTAITIPVITGVRFPAGDG